MQKQHALSYLLSDLDFVLPADQRFALMQQAE
jgi:hypothetical protein